MQVLTYKNKKKECQMCKDLYTKIVHKYNLLNIYLSNCIIWQKMLYYAVIGGVLSKKVKCVYTFRYVSSKNEWGVHE